MSLLSGARHPVGLSWLCAVELCERFSGSLLGSLLLLYLNERLGMSSDAATRIGGAFNGIAYVSSVLGGVVADRFLGTRWAILLGAALLALGYTVLSTDHARALYPAAGLLVLGHAFFKPNIIAAVGKLYDRGDPRRDGAYSRFYVVLNIGAALGPFAGGTLRSVYGWSMAFAVAAAAMLLAILAGVVSFRCLAATEQKVNTAPLPHTSLGSFPAWPRTGRAGLLGAVLLFTATYEQSGLSLLFWARDCTRRSLLGRTLPPSYLLALAGVLVLVLQPLLARLLSALAKRGSELTQLARIKAGILCSLAAYLLMVGAAVMHGQLQAAVSGFWLVGCMVALTFGELLVYPVSMDLMTRLAPPTATAAAMGLWMSAVAVGQWLAGEVAARWGVWSHARFFACVAAFALGALAVLLLATRKIQRASKDEARPRR
jgi:POT family proton-dependent oligopeptide transporter